MLWNNAKYSLSKNYLLSDGNKYEYVTDNLNPMSENLLSKISEESISRLDKTRFKLHKDNFMITIDELKDQYYVAVTLIIGDNSSLKWYIIDGYDGLEEFMEWIKDYNNL